MSTESKNVKMYENSMLMRSPGFDLLYNLMEKKPYVISICSYDAVRYVIQHMQEIISKIGNRH